MPIDPRRYPANWNEISRRVRFERAGNKCEQCGAPNGQRIYRPPESPEKFIIVPDMVSAQEVVRIWGGRPVREVCKTVKVILTVAHLDHNTTNNDEGNLKVLCQRCHLQHDAQEHAQHAAATRRRKRNVGQLPLFEE